jgi:aarF domain-containing kinase
MTVKLGLKEIQSGQLQTRIDQAKILTQSLSQMKGAAMKAGQLISMELADYFPPEALEILSQLQNNATSIPYEAIHQSLVRELGEETVKKFDFINQKPHASASIAQIHQAQWKNQKVALKVQHPGVAESIDSDMKIIEKLGASFCKITQRDMDLSYMFKEMREVLSQEVDFAQEAQLLSEYRSHLLQLDNHKHLYFAPEVINELSTQKLLTMSWEEGESLTHWLRSNPSQEQREQLAHLTLNLYIHEFYDWGLVQTDPNFSNFLVRQLEPNASSAAPVGLVLLDFGSTRRYQRDFINNYIDLVRTVEEGRPRDIIQSAIAFGLLDERESDETKQLFVAMMNMALEPFAVSKPKNGNTKQTFDFSNNDYAMRSQTMVTAFAKSLKYSPPPHRIMFLHRKLGGIFAMLRKLKVQLNLAPYWDMMIEKKGGSK